MQGRRLGLPDVQRAVVPLLQPVVLLRRVLGELRRRRAHQEQGVRRRRRGRPRLHRHPAGGRVVQRAAVPGVVRVGRVGRVLAELRRRVRVQEQDVRQRQPGHDGLHGRRVPDPALRQQTLWLVYIYFIVVKLSKFYGL